MFRKNEDLTHCILLVTYVWAALHAVQQVYRAGLLYEKKADSISSGSGSGNGSACKEEQLQVWKRILVLYKEATFSLESWGAKEDLMTMVGR